MAAPFPTTYYLGLGTSISNVGVLTELSGGSYARLACAFTGTAISGLTQTVGPWVVATAPTPATNIYYMAIFDSLTGGDLIAYWQLNPGTNGTYTQSLTAFPSTVINIVFNTYVAQALNLALLGGSGSSGSILDAGAQIGTANGNPLLTGVRLIINAGGTLTPELGQGEWDGSLIVQDSLTFQSLQTSAITNSITALAGGGTTGAVPTLTGFINRITVAATSGDSVILPPLSVAAVGSIITVANDGVSISKVFADVGASVNVVGTATVAMGPGTSALFQKVTPTFWRTIPTIPT